MTDALVAPTSKVELLAFMQAQWDGLIRASDALRDAVWVGSTDSAGWTIRDHVGHVTAWQKAEIPLLTTGTPIPETTGMPVELWDAGDTDAINEWYRQSIVTKSPAEIRSERDLVFPALIAMVSALSDADLAAPARVRGLEQSDRSLLTVMSENYGYHFDDHRVQIEVLGASE